MATIGCSIVSLGRIETWLTKEFRNFLKLAAVA
jgi:hypothetical protein